MRIRGRRAQGQSLFSLLSSNPSAPQPPLNAAPVDHHPELHAGEKKEDQELHQNAATAADLGDEAARRVEQLPLPPEGNVEEECWMCSGELGAQQGGPAAVDGDTSLGNGDHHKTDEPVIKAGESPASGVSPALPVIKAGESDPASGVSPALPVIKAGESPASGVSPAALPVIKAGESDPASGVSPALPVIKAGESPASGDSPALPVAAGVKDAGSSGAGGTTRKRRNTAVVQLLEGSRCSRVNGRGWRCSQPTQVGYSLCEHHLGKSRVRGAAIGRTERKKKAPAAVAGSAVTAAATKADVPRY